MEKREKLNLDYWEKEKYNGKIGTDILLDTGKTDGNILEDNESLILISSGHLGFESTTFLDQVATDFARYAK